MKPLSRESEIFTRSVAQITTDDALRTLIHSKKQLRIKFGADITATSLHIGHAVNLWKMRQLQEYGHKVVFVVGDFTTQIGDPTGRMEIRKKHTVDNINQWAKNFIKQISKILLTDAKVFEVHRNSEWYKKMKVGEFMELLSLFTHARVIERDMFQRRIAEGKEILLPELLYPILQGYDSVMLKSDMTIIGSDQLFNEGMGRFLQEKFSQPPQVLMTTTITPGLDGGEKMSKSLGNYIGLDDMPRDMFGKAMRILDTLIIPYLQAYTDVPISEIEQIEHELTKGINPKDAKLFFADALVRRYYGVKSAAQEKAYFIKTFFEKEIADTVQVKMLTPGQWNIVEVLMQLSFAQSKSDARRLITQGAVEIDEVRVTAYDAPVLIRHGTIIRVGKKGLVKIK